MKKIEKIKLLSGALLITGIFVGLYFGINHFAFDAMSSETSFNGATIPDQRDPFIEMEHNDVRFMIQEWGRPVGEAQIRFEGDLTQVEAAEIVAKYLYDTYGVTMEGFRMQLTYSVVEGAGSWQAFVMPAEDEDFGDGITGLPATQFYIQVAANTSEILSMDVRGFDTVVEVHNGRTMRGVLLN